MNKAQIGFVVGLQSEARLLAPLGLAVAAGGGTQAGAADAAARLIAAGARKLVSFGFAGGLDPALRPGCLVVPERILENGSSYDCDPELAAWLGGFTPGALLAGTEIAARVAEKSRLFAMTGAVAIDLESGAVARCAMAQGLAFAALRAITDPAGRDLPPAAMIALHEGGTVNLPGVLASVVKQPGQIPLLLALAGDAAKARRALRGRLQTIR